MLTNNQHLIKRVFDLILAFVLIVISFPFLLVLFVMCSIDTKSFGVFMQERIGYKGKVFVIYKFRTILGKDEGNFEFIKSNVTKFGSFLRKSKLDELPQLFNIIKGDMSFVGPRPDIKGYADKLTGDNKIILSVRPGVTGPASIKYRCESKLLECSNPLEFNDKIIWPDKVKINLHYVKNWSFIKDLKYILKTII